MAGKIVTRSKGLSFVQEASEGDWVDLPSDTGPEDDSNSEGEEEEILFGKSISEATGDKEFEREVIVNKGECSRNKEHGVDNNLPLLNP